MTIEHLRQLHQQANAEHASTPAAMRAEEAFLRAANTAVPHLLDIADQLKSLLNNGDLMLRPSQLDSLQEAFNRLETT